MRILHHKPTSYTEVWLDFRSTAPKHGTIKKAIQAPASASAFALACFLRAFSSDLWSSMRWKKDQSKKIKCAIGKNLEYLLDSLGLFQRSLRMIQGSLAQRWHAGESLSLSFQRCQLCAPEREIRWWRVYIRQGRVLVDINKWIVFQWTHKTSILNRNQLSPSVCNRESIALPPASK